MKKLLIFLLIVSVAISFLVVSIEKRAYDLSYYEQSFKDNEIEKVTARSMEELLEISRDIILYLKSEAGNDLLAKHFNQREVLHMVDVQNLFNLARTLKYTSIIAIIFIFIYFIYKKEYITIGKSLLYGPIFTYISMIILGTLSIIDFNKYFTYFHLIFFDNDLWLLNPKTDLMIQMLPERFFMLMARNILLSFLLYMVILQIVGYFIIRKGKKYDKITYEKSKTVFNYKQ